MATNRPDATGACTGRRRGDHDGSQPQPCSEIRCKAFILALAGSARRSKHRGLALLSDEQRLELINLGYRWCGSLDPRCYCQRDD